MPKPTRAEHRAQRREYVEEYQPDPGDFADIERYVRHNLGKTSQELAALAIDEVTS